MASHPLLPVVAEMAARCRQLRDSGLLPEPARADALAALLAALAAELAGAPGPPCSLCRGAGCASETCRVRR